MAADFLHYVVAAFMLGRLKRKYEDSGKVRQDFIKVPRSTNLPGTVLYWTKIVFLVLAFASLVFNFVARLAPVPAAPRTAEIAAPSEAIVCRAGASDMPEGTNP